MRIGSSLILIIIAAVALWFARDAFAPADPEATPPPHKQPLISFAPTDVASITITRQGEQAVINRTSEGSWRMDSPVNDRVDFNGVLALLISMNGMVIEDGFTLDETSIDDANQTAELDEFRLDTAAVDVELAGTDGNRIAKLKIGGITPLSVDSIPTTYVQRLDSDYADTIFVVGGNARLIVDRPFDAWRDHRPLFLAHPPVGIRITEGQRQIELTRSSPGTDWTMESPLKTAANQEAIAELLASLSEPIATSIETESSPAPPTADPLTRSITVTMAPRTANESAPAPMTLTLESHPAGDGDTLILRSNDRDVSLIVPRTAENAFTLDATRFRSRALANIDPVKIFKIIVRDPFDPNRTTMLRRRGREWQVSLRNHWTRANDKLVFDTLTQLNNTQIVEFADDAAADLAPYGLDAPVAQAAFIPMDESNSVRLNIGVDQDGAVFAKFDGKPFIYQVPESIRYLLPTQPGAWLSPSLFDFSAMDLRNVTIEQKEWPTLALQFNFMDNRWIGLLGEKDITPMINVAAAHQLATVLERLRAVRWSASVTSESIARLNDPLLSLAIRIVPTEPDGTESPADEYKLDLTPMSEKSPFWIGRINQRAEVFILDATSIPDLLPQSLLSPE